MTIGDLESRLSSAYGPVRAEMISVTEITRAAEQGENGAIGLLLGDNPGIEREDIWQTSQDDRVCLVCGPLNDRKAGGYDGNQPYWTHPDSGARVQIPAHPRCRCRKRTDFRRLKP
jgi:hypothetical protein